MTEYNHTLTTTAELKRINLQNMQFALRLRELEAENKALKDKLAEYALRPAPEHSTSCLGLSRASTNTLACHYRQAGE